MDRLKLIGEIFMMFALLSFAVLLDSPYEPVIEAAEQIETVWAIEDTRQESEEPLVSKLSNHGVPLGFDKASNTFYCTLGLEQMDAWPDIHLTAECSKDVRLVFVDDYDYDWCKDAIEEGYPYQAMAYTDDAFWYFDIVFTGLPVISLYCGEDIGIEDTAAQMSLSVFDSEPVATTVHTHLRGGGTRSSEKKNLRVKFIRDENGRKNVINLPGFGLRENILLNPMVFDETMLRDRINWKLYGDLLGSGYDGAFGARKTAYVEVFLNDEYQGVYLMMEPMDAEEELAKEGGRNLLTDGVYRSVIFNFADDRPVTQNPLKDVGRYELRYEPLQTRQFGLLEEYLNLLREQDDEAFVSRSACMDMESVVRYVLLRQVACLADNISNNMYLWARMTPEGVRYTLAPWDMDISWGRKPETVGANDENWLAFPLVDRMLVCSVPGLKELMLQRWDEWRGEIFTQEHIAAALEAYEAELKRSGALMRNAERWGMEINAAAAEELTGFALTRLEVIDAAMEMFRDERTVYPPFLEQIDSGMPGYPIL